MAKKTTNKKFWSVRAEKQTDGSSIGNLYLYGCISTVSWWGDEITPKQLLDDIETMGDIDTLKVHIFSDGGDVFAGNAIYSILKQQPAEVHVYIEGIAASIATVIAMAGDQIYISRSAMMMVHNAMFGLFGYYNAGDMQAMIADLEKISEPIIAAYQSGTGMTREEVISMMNGKEGAGTWYTAEEAIEAGLADEYIPEESEASLGAVACIGLNKYEWNGHTFDLSKYQNAPKIKNARRKKSVSKTKAKKKVSAKAHIVKAALTEVTCPECGATFEIEVGLEPVADPVEGTVENKGAVKVKNELVSVTCPECGATFDADVELEPEAEPTTVTEPGDGGDESNTPTENKYNAGVLAERKRIIALDSIIAAAPGSAEIVAQAKKDGSSFEDTSRKVFAAMAANNAGNTLGAAGAAFLAGRATDHTASGAARVSGAPNSGVAGNMPLSAEAKAVNAILAGVKKK